MQTKNTLHKVPYSDSGSLSDGELVYPVESGGLALRFEYERDEIWYSGELRFARVRAFRFRAEGHATPWQTMDAYDTLVEITNSMWVKEIRDESPGAGGEWTLRHYLIYLSSAGVYEVLADSWASTEVEQVRVDSERSSKSGA